MKQKGKSEIFKAKKKLIPHCLYRDERNNMRRNKGELRELRKIPCFKRNWFLPIT